ncbi:MAG TPA: aldo/keto reductase [Anaerolineales bacterium]|nr:aldo/keto reductase [Anaerolineales bacterium]
MKYETLDNIQIPKIGFGSARLGGRFVGGILADRNRDEFFLSALRSAIALGYRHFDSAELYGGGHAEELIGRALHESEVEREAFFVTSKVWPTHLAYRNVLRSCENSLRRLQMDYLDLYLVHWPNPLVPLKETFRALNQLVEEGKLKHVGLSNVNVQLIQRAQSFCETPLFANQIPYSLTHRRYAENGTVKYCQQNHMLITGYTPVDHGHIQVKQTLQSIAEAHRATPYQIALAWLVNQPRVITIPLSFDPKHQRENLEAAEIELTPGEMNQLNALG